MAAINAPRGTRDIVPPLSGNFYRVRRTIEELFIVHGYQLISTPVFEDSRLFGIAIGEESDIVQKEIYAFEDRSGRKLALRPEGTAPTVRAFVEHSMWSNSILPQKLFYFAPMYRYERPQKGRQREFWQAGVEVIGSSDLNLEIEVVKLALKAIRAIGLSGEELRVNTMGCSECRPAYVKVLTGFIAKNDGFCQLCRERSVDNPLRIFDCKNEQCAELKTQAPSISEHLCGECQEAFQRFLAKLGEHVPQYIHDKLLVRGFDYYTGMNFEIRSHLLGAQNAVAGGGRYDRLVQKYGGPPTPALGFAMGIERLLLATENLAEESREVEIFVISVTEEERDAAFDALERLREERIPADMDWSGKSLKAQLKTANKKNARWSVLIGPEERAAGSCKLKEMISGEEMVVSLQEAIRIVKKSNGEKG